MGGDSGYIRFEEPESAQKARAAAVLAESGLVVKNFFDSLEPVSGCIPTLRMEVMQKRNIGAPYIAVVRIDVEALKATDEGEVEITEAGGTVMANSPIQETMILLDGQINLRRAVGHLILYVRVSFSRALCFPDPFLSQTWNN
ncbi:hypothetical protein GIB67_039641 [Kingdonia uniflora]|uniref:Uncharacterized protein n=1 Tax=Kingdonia uniflora TaxID=39325 RepID=A0A7J7MDT8_9MAGN|nr:hypothetical protein GIB67_039641 [Kingdonia uniflora]